MSVPVKTFKELLTSIARRIGVLKPDGTITTGADSDISGDLTDLVNSAMRAAWQSFAWPDAMVITEESVIDHPTVTGARYVPRQTATRTMSNVLNVWNKDPRQSNEVVGNVPCRKLSDGVYIYDANLSTVWCNYRPAAPEYTDEVWVSVTTYAAGAEVLYTDGNVYRSLLGANLNQNPVTATTYWQVVPVLQCVFEPVKQGVISHWKRYQSGQPVTAKDFTALMMADLENEIENIRNEES